MATRIDDMGETVSFTFERQEITTRAGDTIAAALTLAGQNHLRDSVVTGEPRGAFCLMGTCFDCLVEVNGMPNVQACRTIVRQGMDVYRQKMLETGQ